MALDDKSLLNNKLSPLIEGQVPDFVQVDHPVFVNFLKDYYKFLEAGLLTITTTTDYVALETSSSSYILEETDGDRIVTELGAGTKGYFEVDEIITGSTSSATAKVLIDDSRNSRIYITSQQKFITGETITGGTSGSEGTVVEYRANPVQNIQQMLDYADVDNTIYDFLDKMRDSFMNDIPENLASGVSKRNLLKNIKDLYTAKGTSEGHKLFMRILLGENPDIFYPNQYMIKPSAAEFLVEKVMRVLPFENVVSVEGNVYNPGLVAYETGLTMSQAIVQAGGYKPYSIKRRSYVKKANGEIDKANVFVGRVKRLNPGDTVVVPVDPDPDDFDITTFISDLSTTLANIAAILLIVDNQTD
mgnify:CR=1 FL=1